MHPDTAPRPPKSLLRPVGRAIGDYTMIRPNDRILLGISGGKDSLSLLHILRHLQRHAPIRFELGAITIDPLVEGFDPSPLQDYLAGLGVPYHFVREPIMERAQTHLRGDSYCSWCARMKRGSMYNAARAHGYNVLALGQHLDDLAESFLMSAFHGGRLQTMKAHYLNDAGDVRIIRPLVYVRERQLRAFSEAAGLPVIRDNCPACFRMPTQRQHMKELLTGEESHNKTLFKALLSTLRPLMDEKSADELNKISEHAQRCKSTLG
ncbi:MAG: tRNA 2-thiocytidine biosynthesis protein TtcA [Gammaproteobacteria bacterium]|nr:tRNA 2-thiocytidine biosynthesis protein TtcA [Gammaproteobacteria bacterium]